MARMQPQTWTLPQNSECYRALVQMELAHDGDCIIYSEPLVRQVEGVDDASVMLHGMLEQNISVQSGEAPEMRHALLDAGDAGELPVRVFKLLAETYQQIVGLNDADDDDAASPKQ